MRAQRAQRGRCSRASTNCMALHETIITIIIIIIIIIIIMVTSSFFGEAPKQSSKTITSFPKCSLGTWNIYFKISSYVEAYWSTNVSDNGRLHDVVSAFAHNRKSINVEYVPPTAWRCRLDTAYSSITKNKCVLLKGWTVVRHIHLPSLVPPRSDLNVLATSCTPLENITRTGAIRSFAASTYHFTDRADHFAWIDRSHPHDPPA